MVRETLRSLTSFDAQQMDHRDVVRLWESNNATMNDYLQSVPIPYFGVHAATAEHLRYMLQNRRAPWNFWGTFYDKNTDKFRLFQFYSMIGYVSSFTYYLGKQSGGILMFNFEGPDGKNISLPRKRIKGNGIDQEFTFDKKNVKNMIKKLQDEHNRLWETQISFYEEDFDSRYQGIVDVSNLRKCVDDYSKAVALARLDTQYDLASVFDRLEKHE
ncbi:MAG: hypothetical protein HY832_01640 [Candidatus Aenigmarchaeota archaeon]|nr:hypothetical protein [Candidatus Aenigmarchaeota archaeon]